MIICKYKDGSSIRVYKTKQARKKACMLLFPKYVCKDLVSYPNHYSLKVMTINSPTHFRWIKQRSQL